MKASFLQETKIVCECELSHCAVRSLVSMLASSYLSRLNVRSIFGRYEKSTRAGWYQLYIRYCLCRHRSGYTHALNLSHLLELPQVVLL